MKTLFVFLLFATTIAAQEKTPKEERFNLSVIGTGTEFYFNGDVRPAAVALGVAYKGSVLPFAEYSLNIAPNLSSDSTGTAGDLSVLLNAKVYERLSIGLGMRFWEHGKDAFDLSRKSFYFNLGIAWKD